VFTACANGDVILSAGAVNSPKILQLSGIGPGELLRHHGIDVIHDQPEVGANLQDHLQLRCAWRLQGARTLNTLAASWAGKLRIGLEYALRRSGPMSMAPSQLGAFSKSRAGLATPDLEYHVQPLSLEAFGQPLHDFPAITTSVCNLRPSSRGRVEIQSPNPDHAQLIAPNYLTTAQDRQVAVDAIAQARAIMAQTPMKRYTPEEISPGHDAGDGGPESAAARIGTTIFHPSCTVRMGAEATAPLDGQMRLRGLRGLRVVDASAMPNITSGNTNAPTIMMAEKASDMILGRSG
jgi:choline dehydrogenase-like flavoprotein